MCGKLPTDSLRVWLSGSQGCEEMFRLLRSITGIFSTLIIFSLMSVIGRINKLNFISSNESSEEMMFPRVQRRLLQLKEETNKTFYLPSNINEIWSSVMEGKDDAINLAKNCNMILESFEDDRIIHDTEVIMASPTAGEREEIGEDNEANMNDALDEGLTVEEISLRHEENETTGRSRELEHAENIYEWFSSL